MKKKILLSVVFVMILTLALVACQGDKAAKSLSVIEGLKTEYQVNEVPDFSGIKVLVTYNDESTKEVGYSELTITPLDTSVVGDAKITISYDGVKLDVNVTVKGSSIDSGNNVVLTGIKYQSGLPTSIFETEDIIDTIMLKVLATYSDGTTGIIEGDALKTNLAELDFTSAGTKTVVITYNNMVCEHVIEVVKPEIEKIEVDADSVDTVVEAGGQLDLSTIKVYAVYNNGDRVQIPVSDPELDLSKIPDLSVEGEKNFVITYKEQFDCTLVISTTAPVLDRIELNTADAPTSILLGDELSTGAVTATAYLSNNTTVQLANSVLSFDYDVTKAGVAEVTVSYTLDEITKSATYDVSVLAIKSISINANSISTSIFVDNALDITNLSIVIVDENDATHVRSYKDGEIDVDLTTLDTSIAGKDGYISAIFRGIKSNNLTICVERFADYDLEEAVLPKALTDWLSTKENNIKSHFTKQDAPYFVGDDNPFIFTLEITAFDDNDNLIEDLTYTSASKVYLDGVLLTDEELAKYVYIDEYYNSFDFTEEAIGKSFTISTRPRDGVEGREEQFTRTIDVTVVDGYNIYKAYELNYITNWDDFDFGDANVYGNKENRTQTKIVDDFLLGEWNAVRPAGLSAIIIHNNIDIKPTDIPKEYFLDADRANELYDSICVFAHELTPEYPEFTVYGNYFTICSNALPPVVKLGTGNQTDIVSNAQLFGISGDRAVKDAEGYAFDHTQFETTIKDLFLRDDNPTSNTPTDSPRRMRGLIGLKTWYQIVNIENSRAEAFYITYLLDCDYQNVYINDTVFHNSWQNHLFVWSDNPFATSGSSKTEELDLSKCPNGVYPVLTLKTTNSKFTKSGGPTIISQTNLPQYALSAYCGPVIDIDLTDANDMWTYLTGTEAWFDSMGEGILGSVAAQIRSINGPLKAACGGSFVTTEPPVEGLTGSEFMNIVMVNLTAGMELNETLNGTADLDGKLIIDEETILDMSDANGLGYANMVVGMIKGSNNDLAKAPIFVSSEGGIGVFDGKNVMTNLYSTFVAMNFVTPEQVLVMAGLDNATIGAMTAEQKAGAIAQMDEQNKLLLGQGDYITLYYNNMGIVLGYNIDKQTEVSE